ncbi:MAG: LPS export ABC transporter ATP-binding protein [bacterium]|nr:LPS export ABC transporter ATP-binding protein [bacterium]
MTETASPASAAADGNLRAEDLHKSYRRREVVRGVSLSLSPGEVVGFLGPNGAGKTTTFYMVMGLVHPERGRVWFREQDITRKPVAERARMGISFLAQEPSIFRRLSVEDNLRAVLEYQEIPPAEREERIETLLRELEVDKLRKQRADTLSGGERRRVEVARALALNPVFLLLDEPFTGVDPIAVAELQEMIKKLKARGIGVLISDHNVRETLWVCDRAYILNDGVILTGGTPAEIVEHPQVREVYLGERFRL